MKQNIRNIANKTVVVISQLIGLLFRFFNRGKTKLLIYTDSRGFEITKLYNRRNPFSSYAKPLIQKFKSEFYICPEKHTTIFDFLDVWNNLKQDYSRIIMHCGVVDFSPRPMSQIKDIYSLKREKIVSLFGEDYFNSLCSYGGYSTTYMGEKTTSILPMELLEPVALKLKEIPGLIWITSNPVDLEWDGNYSKKRPDNINIVVDSSTKLKEYLLDYQVVDLTNWTKEDIHKYTCDNIHFSHKGMKLLAELILKKI